MPERLLVRGSETIGWRVISVGCRHFFGYPIAPGKVIEKVIEEMHHGFQGY